MPIRLPVYDETTSGDRREVTILELLSERITVRELIRERVYEEVREFNADQGRPFHGLIQPTDSEAILNGYKLKTARKLDWEKQLDTALQAFQSNGFFILVDDRQVESLDEEITLTPTTIVSFVKLVPLVGG